MRQRSRQFVVLALALTSTVVFACDSDDILNVVLDNTAVRMEDQCDSASFNAALGAGTCITAGNTTFAQFTAELAATQQVAAWRFVPAAFSMRIGQAIVATNFGGEQHTFTRVAAFGGGINPDLNTASGNLVEAPECANLRSIDFVAPGGTFTTLPAATTGTHLYQCCIHPWMRSTVAVNP